MGDIEYANLNGKHQYCKESSNCNYGFGWNFFGRCNPYPYCQNPNGGCGPGYVNISNFEPNRYNCTNPYGPWQNLKGCPPGYTLSSDSTSCYRRKPAGLNLRDNEWCTVSHDCASGNCNFMKGWGGYCGPSGKLPNGYTCTSDSWCSSGNCINGKCATNPPPPQCSYTSTKDSCSIDYTKCTTAGASISGTQSVTYKANNTPCNDGGKGTKYTQSESCSGTCPPKCTYASNVSSCSANDSGCNNTTAGTSISGKITTSYNATNAPCIDADNKLGGGYISSNTTSKESKADCSYTCPSKCSYNTSQLTPDESDPNSSCNSDTKKCAGNINDMVNFPGFESIMGTINGFLYPNNYPCVKDNKVVYKSPQGKQSSSFSCSVSCPCKYGSPQAMPTVNSSPLNLSDTCTKTCYDSKTNTYGTINQYRPYVSGSIAKCGTYSLKNDDGSSLPTTTCNTDKICQSACTESGNCVNEIEPFATFDLLRIKNDIIVSNTNSNNVISNVNNSGLLYHYPFDTNLLNYASGSGINDATISNVIVAASTTKTGNGSAQFPGTSNQSFKVPSFKFGTNGITIACWLKLDNLKQAMWSRLFDFGSSQASSNNNFGIAINGADLTGFLYGASSGNNSGQFRMYTIPDTNWHHVCLTIFPKGTNTWYLYIDGSLVFTQFSGYPNINTTPTNCYIGKSNWSADGYFKGNMNAFVIFNRVLNKTEIDNLYKYPSRVTINSNPTSVTNVSVNNAPVDNLMYYEAELARAINHFNNEYAFYVSNCNGKDGVKTIPMDTVSNPQSKNCNELLNDIQYDANNIVNYTTIKDSEKNLFSGSVQKTSEYDTNYRSLMNTYSNILSLREDLDNKLKELYDLPNSKSIDYTSNYDGTIYSGILVTALATAMIYYTFTKL